MLQTLGKMPTGAPPKGFFKAVHFPVLNMLDTETGDGRLLESAGAGVRELPLSIRAQFASLGGHSGAVTTGTLFEVTIDPEGKVTSGNGFLLDNEEGRKHAKLIHLGAMRGNSVDLADVKYRIEWKSDDPSSPDFFEYTIIFTKHNIAATTGVGTPAFAEARAELPDGMTDDELMASLEVDPMDALVCEFDTITINFDVPTPVTREQAEELLAAGIVQKRELFFKPESRTPQKGTVHADNTISGHLGLWTTCHDGVEGQCLMIPRPTDGYASFNKPGVLTDRGIVETGPIFAFGGHRKIGSKDPAAAYGGIENAWADIRITEGVLGPWMSGVVRPGTPDDVVYAARASRLSGHWVGGKLKAIVSVNAEGFEVPGSGGELAASFASGFAASVNDSGVVELVASFPRCESGDPIVDLTVDLTDSDRESIIAEVTARLLAEGATLITETTTVTETTDDTLLTILLADDDDEDDVDGG